ncbi:hypothetical protein ACN6MY_20235 [Peribacillus sp. B-H-3]
MARMPGNFALIKADLALIIAIFALIRADLDRLSIRLKKLFTLLIGAKDA